VIQQATPLGQPLAGRIWPIWSVAFSPDGHILASASGDDMYCLEHHRPGQTHTARPTPHQVTPASCTGGVSAGRHTSQRKRRPFGAAVDVSNPARPHPWAPHRHTDARVVGAFSRTGTPSPARRDGRCGLWNVSDPARPAPTGPLTGHTDAVWSVAFSPVGQPSQRGRRSDGSAWDMNIEHAIQHTLRHTNTLTQRNGASTSQPTCPITLTARFS